MARSSRPPHPDALVAWYCDVLGMSVTELHVAVHISGDLESLKIRPSPTAVAITTCVFQKDILISTCFINNASAHAS
jgi:hypothetical protein